MNRDVQQVFVWCHLPGDITATLVGRLQVPAGAAFSGSEAACSFEYDERYLVHAHALPLDPFRLPLQFGPSHERHAPLAASMLFGAFTDAMPESWGRYVIDQRLGRPASQVDYLLGTQDDRVGHLSFSAHPERPPTSGRLLQLDEVDKAWRAITALEAGEAVPPALEGRVRPNTGLGGAKPKLTLASAHAQWLAKFPSQHDDARFCATRAEAGVLDLAAVCGIRVAEARLVPLTHASGQAGARPPAALLVRRFDRTAAAGGGWLRDAYVSARTAVQSAGTPDTRRFMATYTEFAEQLQRWSSQPAADRHTLFRRLVFNCCVSNTDDHDRNHGLVADEAGHLYRLAPAFDLTPRIHGTRRRQQAMAFGDHGADATRDNLLSAAREFQIADGAARLTVDEIESLVDENWRRCLAARGLTESELAALAPCFAPLPDPSPAPRSFVR